MSKIKYKFNYETLSFDQFQVSFKDILYKKILPRFTLSFVLGIGFFVTAVFLIDSPFAKKFKDENSSLVLKYEMLNKRFDHVNTVLSNMQQRDDNVYRLIFEMQPIPTTIRTAGFGGTSRYSKLKGFDNSNLMIEITKKLDIIAKQVVVQSKSYDEVIELVKSKEKMIANIPAIQPIRNKELHRFGSPFGNRIDPITFQPNSFHPGIDLTCPTGTKVYATGNGIVMKTEISNEGLGNNVRINHGYGYLTVYAHLSKIIAREGKKVKRGDLIGLVGSTGRSTCPHLHYEVRINNQYVDPLNFYYNDMTDEQYKKLLESASNR